MIATIVLCVFIGVGLTCATVAASRVAQREWDRDQIAIARAEKVRDIFERCGRCRECGLFYGHVEWCPVRSGV